MQKGSIGVKTENIFPVIKKFLYSENEIFLREIISNAVDATNKLKTLASAGEYSGELGDLTIQVEVDKQKKTITVRDKGIGMTEEEVDKYINQIAFSGATEFVEKFKTNSEAESANIIGHFGLGFYSAFMVSSKVSLITKSFKQNADEKGVIWECDGSPCSAGSNNRGCNRNTGCSAPPSCAPQAAPARPAARAGQQTQEYGLSSICSSSVLLLYAAARTLHRVLPAREPRSRSRRLCFPFA